MTPFGERFLRSAHDLLTADGSRLDSEPLVVGVGRDRFEIDGLPDPVRVALVDKYGDSPALGSNDDPLTLEVALAPSRHFVAIDPNLWLMDFDQQFYEREVLLAGRNLFGRFRVSPARGGTIWISEAEDALWEDMIGNCLRLMVAHASLAPGGALLHSAAVLVEGGARLFVGNRDCGKTSLCRLALERGLTVLSDDLNVVQPTAEGGFEAIKMPFAGELGQTTGESSGSWPIESAHLLHRSARYSEPPSLAQALAALVAAGCFVNRDPHRHDALTDNLLDLAQSLRPGWLDPTDEAAVDRLLPG